MRQEASSSGLILKPTDLVWMPDDLDFGTSDSMSIPWRLVEIIPIKHQVTFSGSGENARRWHLFHPRRIIPGQKVHASVLFANAYRPRATLGPGFDVTAGSEVTSARLQSSVDGLPKKLWETRLFDATAAKELVNHLTEHERVAPIYLDRLLFMLRFKEGMDSIRELPECHEKLRAIAEKGDNLVKLIAIVACFEASEGQVKLSKDIYDSAREYLKVLAERKHRDCTRVLALLRPLTKHDELRESLLTPDVVTHFVTFLDSMLKDRRGQPGENFIHVMDGLVCLLQCDALRDNLIKELVSSPDPEHYDRLLSMLAMQDNKHLIASLRVLGLIAQKARGECVHVKPRLRELASTHKCLVGQLAVEVLLALYDPEDPKGRLETSLRDSSFRANLASALSRPNVDSPQDSGSNSSASEGDKALRQLFGLDDNIRKYLLEQKAMHTFVDRLQHKRSALLSAYALMVAYPELVADDLRQHIIAGPAPGHIVNMLRLDYFDEAIGGYEGFQIFYELMKNGKALNILRETCRLIWGETEELRRRVTRYDITEVLAKKLGGGKPDEVRTSLLFLSIIRSFDSNGKWAEELVNRSLDHLKAREWKNQKAGVTILSSLAQTKYGIATINNRVSEIIDILLPKEFSPNPASGESEGTNTATTNLPPRTGSTGPRSKQPPSWMLGPACALRALSEDPTLRATILKTQEFRSLKDLMIAGNLVGDTETSAWQVKTPTVGDVSSMIEKMIGSVEGQHSTNGLTSIGDSALPHIQHWDRLGDVVRHSAIAAVTGLPVVLGVSALTVTALIALTPVFVSIGLYR
ncbi:hypothetical protein HYDPIDRAFT_190199 [Hydnomerulius pinastri MD-312]|uniref:Unplaced genomic scaffold scaffold_43, whole genome shotgun sequence n=1 Tax=Hydnomerulius pinastri MD-312 TaxID=994086 RepID=A0A0C9W236_9AGAM|nr:hypothetical protein HYDPIDRAFT_190199 [Hydnomerulius pinastri MD-312]